MFPYPPQPSGFPPARRPVVQAALPLFVLVRHGAGSAWPQQVLCEPVTSGEAAGTDAMVLYFSPLEASIDALWQDLPPERYQVLPVSAFTPDDLLRRHHGRLPVCLHLAWGAQDGCLAVRAQGGPVRISSASVAQVSAMTDTIPLAISHAELAGYARLWEDAGLFAHSETHARLLALSPQERHRHAERALMRIPGKALPGQQINQLALYDAESAQWHFIALDLLAGQD
ncbi:MULTISPECIES: hypothetical protein [Herbaspirillum]|uniref:hypothetical protein n=1 Tax=Herbaspirillum TaxID=963 RepID=UPI001393DCA3|nr:hypothetical protein [Herbaspirillum sp. CAH-3]